MVALVLGLAAPILALADIVTPVGALTSDAGVLGAVTSLAGIALSVAAQRAMGASWRIGVDADERTDLVTGGVFAHVRNPFFTATIAVAVGLVLMVPSVVAFPALAALIAAVELQVRVVEEPYLLGTQGDGYRAYAGRVGRLVPLVGRLRSG